MTMHGKYWLFILSVALIIVACWAFMFTQPPPHDTAVAAVPEAKNPTVLPAKADPRPQALPAAETPQPNDRVDELTAFLEPSADPRDILLLLAMRDSGDKDDLARLRELLHDTSERAMVLYLIAKFKVEGKYVATEQELAALKAAAPQNAVVDDLLSQRAYQQGDITQALYHLQQGAKRNVNSSYQLEYLTLTGGAYLRRNGYLTIADFTAITGIAAAYPASNLGFVTRSCAKYASDANWANACAQRGQGMFEYGETTLDRAVGARLALAYMEGDTGPYQNYSDGVQEALIALGSELDRRMADSAGVIDGSAWNRYLQLYAEHGEIIALRYLVSLFP